MSGRKCNPPAFALWLLRHARSGGDNDALAGDLIERYREGQTRGWFWRQALAALAVRAASESQAHGPHFCYAAAGMAMPILLWGAVDGAPLALHWWALPWPWSQVVMELLRPALLALAALPVLALGLAIGGEFRWSSVARTGTIQLALLSATKYLREGLAPWLTRPVPGHPYARISVIPPVGQLLLVFGMFLLAAWLGCRRPSSDPLSTYKRA